MEVTTYSYRSTQDLQTYYQAAFVEENRVLFSLTSKNRKFVADTLDLIGSSRKRSCWANSMYADPSSNVLQ